VAASELAEGVVLTEAGGRPTVAEVDLDAVGQHVRIYRERVGRKTAVWAVVKADGYGHGAVPVSRAALGAGAEGLVVALAEEGVALRRAGIAAPILVLGAHWGRQPEWIATYGLEAAVVDLGSAHRLSAAAQATGRPIPVHIKIDTGMGRVGFLWDGPVVDQVSQVLRLPGLVPAGLMTHLAQADDPDPMPTVRQWERFLDVVDGLRRAGMEVPRVHAANSAAGWRFPGMAADLIRLGIALYGLAPGPDGPPLRPAMTVRSAVVQVKRVAAGFSVGYGATYQTPGPTTLATVPMGYADGLRRGLSNRGAVLVGGQRAAIVGRVSMDQIVVAVPDHVPVAPGDPVVLLGSQGEASITADDWARWLGTIHYEVVTGISPRVPRVYRVGGRLVAGADVEAALSETLGSGVGTLDQTAPRP